MIGIVICEAHTPLRCRAILKEDPPAVPPLPLPKKTHRVCRVLPLPVVSSRSRRCSFAPPHPRAACPRLCDTPPTRTTTWGAFTLPPSYIALGLHVPPR